ncbi:MAG: hypothetical protein JWM47_4303, partial [Acidimicrobiales bacterium]|nr:hypothetical protein [Acidimicrobiales bacterium]
LADAEWLASVGSGGGDAAEVIDLPTAAPAEA